MRINPFALIAFIRCKNIIFAAWEERGKPGWVRKGKSYLRVMKAREEEEEEW